MVFKGNDFFQLQKKTLFPESSPLVVVENPKETIQNALPTARIRESRFWGSGTKTWNQF